MLLFLSISNYTSDTQLRTPPPRQLSDASPACLRAVGNIFAKITVDEQYPRVFGI